MTLANAGNVEVARLISAESEGVTHHVLAEVELGHVVAVHFAHDDRQIDVPIDDGGATISSSPTSCHGP